MRYESTASLCALVLGLFLLVQAWALQDPVAFAFPLLWAGLMVLFAAGLLVQSMRRRPEGASRPSAAALPWRRLLPALGVGGAYLGLVQHLGFYVSSWLAFSLLVISYAPRPLDGALVLRRLALSTAFVVALYLLFAWALAVQAPRGWLL